MKKLRSKDLIKAHDDAAIAASSWFTLIRFVGRSGRETGPVSVIRQRERRDFRAEDYGDGPAALAAARRAKAQAGRDEFRRPCTIYAVTASGMTLFVE